MSKVTVMFHNVNMTGFYFGDPVVTANRMLAEGGYMPAVMLEVKETGIDAADEMFDLSNNPDRDDERTIRWGRNNRSLSVGDIVKVDGQNLLCASFGWEVL